MYEKEAKKSEGAFWMKMAKNGNTFYSGHLNYKGEKIFLVMFPNTNKKSEKSPDFDIKLSEMKPQQ